MKNNWEKVLLEDLMEVFYKQRNDKNIKIVAFIGEVIFSLFIIYILFPELKGDPSGQLIIYGILILLMFLIFYMKIIRSPKREEKIKKNLKEVVERIKNFKDFQNGKTRFNFKKELTENKIAKIEKSIDKNLKILSEVSTLTKYMALSPINFNYFQHEHIKHMTATTNLLNKLKEFKTENKI
ncbi:MAG: hypothetical protein CR959_00440 [Fusobacteriales bacterium]|nr:MAG: hypothetical protein CR959_00440 [Fusobacteriales bacterium]